MFDQLAEALKAEGLIDEYFEPGCELAHDNTFDEPMPRNVRWVAAWAVTGGSEGHYIHVELVYEDRRVLLALGKTFLGWDHAWTIAKRAAQLLDD